MLTCLLQHAGPLDPTGSHDILSPSEAPEDESESPAGEPEAPEDEPEAPEDDFETLPVSEESEIAPAPALDQPSRAFKPPLPPPFSVAPIEVDEVAGLTSPDRPPPPLPTSIMDRPLSPGPPGSPLAEEESFNPISPPPTRSQPPPPSVTSPRSVEEQTERTETLRERVDEQLQSEVTQETASGDETEVRPELHREGTGSTAETASIEEAPMPQESLNLETPASPLPKPAEEPTPSVEAEADEEEDEEAARRARIAKRMAAMGGMQMMNPFGMVPRAPVKKTSSSAPESPPEMPPSPPSGA